MSNTVVREVAAKRSGQAPPDIERNQAVSFVPAFSAVRELIGGYPAPERPNRNRPAILDDPQLREELDAWDAASDDALRETGADLPE